MLSTFHSAKTVVVRDKRGNFVQKPEVIVDYVQKMGGVDVADQMQGYCGIFRRTKKYWRKLFFYLLNMLLCNAYVLHRKYGSTNMDQYHFRMALARRLLEDADDAPTPLRRGRRCADVPRRLTGRHFPSLIPAAPGSKRKP